MNHDEIPWRLLVWTSVVSMGGWIARALSSGQKISVGRFVGGCLGASIANISFGALAIDYWDVSPLFVLGAAGPIGWMGGDALAALSQFVLKRFGVTPR